MEADALTAEALEVLVDQRLQREGSLARCTAEDVRRALAVAAAPVFAGVTECAAGGFIVERRLGPDRGSCGTIE